MWQKLRAILAKCRLGTLTTSANHDRVRQAQRALAAMVAERRDSYEVRRYRERRAAALKGRG